MSVVLPALVDVPALLRVGGALHLVVLCANIPALRRLDFAGNLAGAAPIVRQIFWAHFGWIALTLLAFAGMDLAFPETLAGADPLGTYVSAVLATLWTGRLIAQLVLYDRAIRRQHRVADVVLSLVFLGLASIHAVAAIAAPLSGGARP